MDLSLNEGQKILKKKARDFFEKECPKSLVREAQSSELGYSEELYTKMAKLGWLGMGIPEEYGGTAGDLTDIVILYEEVGRALVPGPHFISGVVCAHIILGCCSEEQKKTFLLRIASGESIFSLAIYEPDAGYTASSITLKATAKQQDYVLQGTKLFVPYAHISDHLISVTRTLESTTEEGISLFIVDTKLPGISFNPLVTLAGDKQSEVLFQEVRVSNGNALGSLHKGWVPLKEALQKAVVVQCAEMVGGTEKVLEMAVDYAKQRFQFGRPIGSFQVIQHKCADMAAVLDGARYITYEAACKVRDGDSFAPEVAMAKAYTSTAYRKVTTEAHQIFAGAGFMMDHDLHLYYRRAKALELSLGDVDYQVKEVAQRLGF